MDIDTILTNSAESAGRTDSNQSEGRHRSDETEATERTAQRHLRAFRRGDVDGVLADYADMAVFYTPEGALRGKAEIRPFFERLIERFPPEATFDAKRLIVDGELAYLVWTGESTMLRIPFATDTLIVRGGKIVKQTFAGQIEMKDG